MHQLSSTTESPFKNISSRHELSWKLEKNYIADSVFFSAGGMDVWTDIPHLSHKLASARKRSQALASARKPAAMGNQAKISPLGWTWLGKRLGRVVEEPVLAKISRAKREAVPPLANDRTPIHAVSLKLT